MKYSSDRCFEGLALSLKQCQQPILISNVKKCAPEPSAPPPPCLSTRRQTQNRHRRRSMTGSVPIRAAESLLPPSGFHGAQYFKAKTNIILNFSQGQGRGAQTNTRAASSLILYKISEATAFIKFSKQDRKKPREKKNRGEKKDD